jgi:hypothetical protein
VDVIVEKIEFEPFAAQSDGPGVPPAPTVIGKAVAVTETLLAGVQ